MTAGASPSGLWLTIVLQDMIPYFRGLHRGYGGMSLMQLQNACQAHPRNCITGAHFYCDRAASSNIGALSITWGGVPHTSTRLVKARAAWAVWAWFGQAGWCQAYADASVCTMGLEARVCLLCMRS